MDELAPDGAMDGSAARALQEPRSDRADLFVSHAWDNGDWDDSYSDASTIAEVPEARAWAADSGDDGVAPVRCSHLWGSGPILSAAWMLLIRPSERSGLAAFVELAPSLVSPLPIELKSWS